jgi:hypothetical protein
VCVWRERERERERIRAYIYKHKYIIYLYTQRDRGICIYVSRRDAAEILAFKSSTGRAPWTTPASSRSLSNRCSSNVQKKMMYLQSKDFLS